MELASEAEAARRETEDWRDFRKTISAVFVE
jgi:hypothetical protein